MGPRQKIDLKVIRCLGWSSRQPGRLTIGRRLHIRWRQRAKIITKCILYSPTDKREGCRDIPWPLCREICFHNRWLLERRSTGGERPKADNLLLTKYHRRRDSNETDINKDIKLMFEEVDQFQGKGATRRKWKEKSPSQKNWPEETRNKKRMRDQRSPSTNLWPN